MSNRKSDALRDEADLMTRGKIIPHTQDYAQNSLRKKIIDSIRMDRDLKLEDLMDDVSIEGGYKTEAVAHEIMALQDEGLIELSESRKCETFLQYMVSANSVWFLGSIATIAVTLALVFVPLYLLSFFSGPVVYLRYFFGSVLVLFLPGYSLMEALFVKKSSFDDLTKYALSFVMSLALVTLISLVLGVSPIGLETLPITVSVALFTIILLFIALKRRYGYYEIAHHFDDR
ncbi:MAG: DUF1616 domain-containing protein [archaeon]|nr:DUF1616 domain-containing protein [archaeon]